MTGDDLLELLQADVLAVLKNCPELADANIIPEDEGDMEKTILQNLGTLTGGSTAKAGLVIVVMLPEVTEAEPNLPGPPMELSVEIQIIEAPKINRSATGTAIRSSVAAVRTLASLQLRGLGNYALRPDAKPLQPVRVKPGYLSHTVKLLVSNVGIDPPAKPAGVTATWLSGPGTLQLTCATPGAAIRYTTDGTFPTPAATLYTAPIAAPAVDTTYRAAAYLAGTVPGDVTQVKVTA